VSAPASRDAFDGVRLDLVSATRHQTIRPNTGSRLIPSVVVGPRSEFYRRRDGAGRAGRTEERDIPIG